MDELKEQLKKMKEDVNIPESLKPENINKLLEEHPQKKSRRRYLQAAGVVAAAVLLIVAIPFAMKKNMVSIVPGENVADETNATGVEGPVYDKLYEIFQAQLSSGKREDSLELDEELSDGVQYEGVPEKKSKSSEISADLNYSQVNSQVDGVGEGDIVVTDGNHIYVDRKNLGRVQILKAEGKSVKEVSMISYKTDGFAEISEIYVQSDRLILVGETKEKINGECNTILSIYDISRPESPKKMKAHTQSGQYETSRLVNGYLYTFSNYAVYDCLSGKPETYVPLLDDKIMKEKDIYLPEIKSGQSYYVLTALEIENPKSYQSQKAFVSASNPVFYVTESNIYLAMDASYYSWYRSGDSSFNKTNITKFSYEGSEIKKTSETTIKGQVNNQFSFDEYEGNLRAVVTYYKDGTEYNAVYVLDKDLKELGSVGELAKNERIYSARFMGDKGYFVTYRETDPLFSIDFSNPKKPRIIGKLKIPGFSNYLHFYGKDLLLGVGEDGDGRTKLSMFDISNPKNVKEIDKKIIKESWGSESGVNHKEILVDVQKNIIGLPIDITDDDDNVRKNYVVYSYKKGFKKKLQTSFKRTAQMWDYDYDEEVRGLYIGDILYVVNTDTGVKTFDLNTFKKLGKEFVYSKMR